MALVTMALLTATQASSVMAGPYEVDDADTTTAPGGGDPGWADSVPPQREAYCPPDSEFPEFHLVRLGVFKYGDGPVANFGAGGDRASQVDWSTGDGAIGGVIPVAERVSQWCQSAEAGTSKAIRYWLAVVTPDSVAFQTNLLAQVRENMPAPEIEWLDIDLDHGWLWVRVEHHVSIQPVDLVEASETRGNPVSGYATAWVRAVPVSLRLDLDPYLTDEDMSAECDLTAALSAEGCRIRFVHASSISDDAWFHGSAELEWTVSSNSGKYDGAGPFTTSSEFEIQVAEAMSIGGG